MFYLVTLLVGLLPLVVESAAADIAPPAPIGEAESVFVMDEQNGFIEIVLGPILRRARPIAMTTHKMAGARPYIGHVTRTHYIVRRADSTAELHSEYSRWLASSGFTTLLDVRGDSPMAPGGTSWALRAYGDLPTEVATELSGTRDKGRRRYLVAERKEGDEHAVIALLINPRRTDEVRVQLDVVLVDGVATAPLSMPADELGSRLRNEGSVPLEGVRYVGKKAGPRDSSALGLAQVAVLLRNDPGLSLTVVGRVRDEERPDSAMQLALVRAKAVMELLIVEHGAPADRLSARLLSADESESRQQPEGNAKPNDDGDTHPNTEADASKMRRDFEPVIALELRAQP
jgi:hypothetical protein